MNSLTGRIDLVFKTNRITENNNNNNISEEEDDFLCSFVSLVANAI